MSNRICDICGKVDDSPRHIILSGPGESPTRDAIASQALKNAAPEDFDSVLAQVRDDTSHIRHLYCCAKYGCPDTSCDKVLATVPPGKDLKEHLLSGAVDGIGRELNEARIAQKAA